MTSFSRPDGGTAEGYLAEPAGPARGAVVVLHDWWGLTDEIRHLASRLAGEGYRALAVDLYRGFVASHPLEGMRRLKALDFVDAARQDTAGAVAYLGGRAAVLGLSMGAAVAIIAASSLPSITCAVGFYGVPREREADLGNLHVPLQLHFAGVDEWYPPEVLDTFEARLRGASVPAELHRYPAAAHGFMGSRAHDADAAALAWSRVLAFLAEHAVR